MTSPSDQSRGPEGPRPSPRDVPGSAGFAAAATLLAYAVDGLAARHLADRIGRVRTLQLTPSCGFRSSRRDNPARPYGFRRRSPKGRPS